MREPSPATASRASATSSRPLTPISSPFRFRATPSIQTESTFRGWAARTSCPSGTFSGPMLSSSVADQDHVCPLARGERPGHVAEAESLRTVDRRLAEDLVGLIAGRILVPASLDAHLRPHAGEHVRVVGGGHRV